MFEPPAVPVEAPMQAPVEAPAEVPAEAAPAAQPAAPHNHNKIPRYAPALSAAPRPPQRQHSCPPSRPLGSFESLDTTWAQVALPWVGFSLTLVQASVQACSYSGSAAVALHTRAVVLGAGTAPTSAGLTLRLTTCCWA